MTDIKTPPPFSYSVSCTIVDATAIDNAIVDATVTLPYLTQFLVNLSRFFDASMLNMLPHVIAEVATPNITVTIHSVEIQVMFDSGAQVNVLPSGLAADFDLTILLPSVTREVRTFGNHQVTLQGLFTLEL